MSETHSNRRQFLQLAGSATVISLAGQNVLLAQNRRASANAKDKKELKLGLASYTLRQFKIDQAIEMTKRVGLKYIALKDMHLAMNSSNDEIHETAKKVSDAGLVLYGGGVIYMKDEAQVNRAFDYAKEAGMKVIIGVPSPELLPLVDKKVKEYDIIVAIHNHGPGDKVYPTPESAYEKIKDLDKRIGLCNDIGHTQRIGVDPSASIIKLADRLHDLHIKDVTEATAKGQVCEVGRGVIDIPKVIKTLKQIKFDGVVSFEYEKDANDPLAGLAESVGYVKGVIASVS